MPPNTSTPTNLPGPINTPQPSLDAFEPNYDFGHAADIGLNVRYTNINFMPLPGQTINNDFFKVRVKSGMLVTCETLDLSPGTDTNMILYGEPQVEACQDRPVTECVGWGNNDVDRARGELRSRVTVSIDYTGFLYILVGQGYAVPPAQAFEYTYSLQCTSGQTGATATPGPATRPPGVVPTWTPAPRAPTPSISVPTATATRQ